MVRAESLARLKLGPQVADDRQPLLRNNVSLTVTASAPARVLTDNSTGRLVAVRVLRNRALATLMLGHFTVDMYVGVIPMLYPLLRDRFALSLETVGYVSLAYGGAASLSQPLFGLLADRKGTRWVGLALFWTAATFALLGFVSSFSVLLLLTALSGLGSGLYHPMGAMARVDRAGPVQFRRRLSIKLILGPDGSRSTRVWATRP